LLKCVITVAYIYCRPYNKTYVCSATAAAGHASCLHQVGLGWACCVPSLFLSFGSTNTQPGHFSTENRKPNRTEPNCRFFGFSVRFRFLVSGTSVIGSVFGSYPKPNRKPRTPNIRNSSAVPLSSLFSVACVPPVLSAAQLGPINRPTWPLHQTPTHAPTQHDATRDSETPERASGG
jgi:hypothetical protein